MKEISNKEIIRKITLENPWWEEQGGIDDYFKKFKPRAYLDSLYEVVTEKAVKRAIVLMGARRVGKTVLLYHIIQKLIDSGIDPKRICYISIEAPVYIGCSLEQIVSYYLEIYGFKDLGGCYVFFDEIQYLKGWEVHLKKLVDDFRDAKFVASGSAAAALKLKSAESGAGRFTDFHLPPLTFYEYLYLQNMTELVEKEGKIDNDINRVNEEFVNYLNFGGYPEAIFSEPIKKDPGRYIRSDIIDKVLLRDLPGLYGIQDIQELSRLFTMLAYNTGNEVSLDELSKGSSIVKNTIKKYLEYLEASFLIKILHRVDQSGKRFKKANFFKVYLTNPSMRCALFGPVTADDEFMGYMVETAVMSQFPVEPVYYARWHGGEVDVVILEEGKIEFALEIKWSNRFFDRPEELKSLIRFAKFHGLERVSATAIDKSGTRAISGVTISFTVGSIFCYRLGKMSTEYKISSVKRLIEEMKVTTASPTT
ncbi:MAG: ATP-binding protein [Deltaproteobacteria bacterium]|nr:ATP-binding protein [Deltaproteobacteria bacterium]